MYDKGVLWSDTKSLAEETFGQLRIVGQTILQADVEHGQVTSGWEGARDVKDQTDFIKFSLDAWKSHAEV